MSERLAESSSIGDFEETSRELRRHLQERGDPPRTQSQESSVAELNVQEAAEEHWARIHRAALMLSGNSWDADDLVQETFLVASREAERFEGRSSVYTWLYGIMLNLERRRRRRAGTQRSKLKVLWEGASLRTTSTPAASAPVEAAEWKRSLWGYVAQLPDGQRHALVLRFSEYLSYEEISQAMDCPLGTVKSRIFHGLATLREKLTADDADVRFAPLDAAEDLRHVM